MSEQMDYKKLGVPPEKRPRIRTLTTCFGWDAGNEFTIVMETDGELYFNDVFRRWTCVEKKDEGVEFEYIRKYHKTLQA